MRRVLIIEDEELLKNAYVLILKSEGYDVEDAANGQAGLAKLQAFEPDLIILDMLMPVMNGKKFLQAAKVPERYPGTKVLIVSNISDPIKHSEGCTYGVTESLVKADLSPLELAQIAKKHCPL